MASLTVLHGCRTLQLSKGFNTLIDANDFDEVRRFKWHFHGQIGNGYAARNISTGSIPRQKVLRLHRELSGVGPDRRVDHRNGDPLDNRRCNLRVATPLENGRNIHRTTGRSKFKGVCWNPVKRHWKATIRVVGKRVYLGSSQTEEGAARLYDAAAREHFGEFAYTNEDIHGPY